jgi:uncharacterized membrane protein YcaP (DUF421 family)
MAQFLFSDAAALGRTALLGVAAYAALIAILRVSGKRTLSKMNAFDLVVTVALGSSLATILLNKSVTLAEGVLALALLVALQFAITWTSVRIGWVRRIVTGEPTLLARDGRCLPQALRRARVTEDEVLAAVRDAGLASLADAKAVVLETDGSFSVIRVLGRRQLRDLERG